MGNSEKVLTDWVKVKELLSFPQTNKWNKH